MFIYHVTLLQIFLSYESLILFLHKIKKHIGEKESADLALATVRTYFVNVINMKGFNFTVIYDFNVFFRILNVCDCVEIQLIWRT